MRLTSFTDYSLRTLLYLAANRDRLVTIQDIADLHVISKNHLMKVVYQLGLAGLVETVRGRNGGLRLGKEPKDINIGALVRATETDFFMAECFDRSTDAQRRHPSLPQRAGSANAGRHAAGRSGALAEQAGAHHPQFGQVTQSLTPAFA
jgi:Rrf2 family protein